MGQFDMGQQQMGMFGGKGKMDGKGKMEGKEGKGKKPPKPEKIKEEWEMEEDMMFLK